MLKNLTHKKYFPALPRLSGKKLFIIIIKLFVSTFFLWSAFQKVELTKVDLQTVWLLPFTMAIVLAFLQIFLNSTRWMLLIEEISEKSNSFYKIFFIYYFSCFLNQIFPSIAGDAVRVISSKNLNATLGDITESVVHERIVSLFTLLFVSIAAFPWIYTVDYKIAAALNAVLILCFLGLSFFIIFVTLIKNKVSIWVKIPQPLVFFINNLRWLFISKRSWSTILPLSLTVHIFSVLMLWLIAISVNSDIGIYRLFQICPLMLLAQILPISFGGWGARETIAVILMAQSGVSPSTAITISILFGLVLVVVSIPGLIIWVVINFKKVSKFSEK